MLNQRISYIYTYLFQQLYSLACIYSDFYFLQSLWSENGEQQISYSVDDCWIFFSAFSSQLFGIQVKLHFNGN